MMVVLAQDVLQLFVTLRICGWHKGHEHVEHVIKSTRRDMGYTSWSWEQQLKVAGGKTSTGEDENLEKHAFFRTLNVLHSLTS